MERIVNTGDGGLQLVQAQLSDIGLRRKTNEDALGFFVHEDSPPTQLAVICDGVGGNAAGEVASQLAVETVERSFFGAGNPVDPVAALRRAIQAANAEIQVQASRDPGLTSMATTCTAVAFRGDSFHVAHVGDCRAYLLRDGEITQLTEDHSLAEEYQRRGEPLPASQQALANVLTRCLGIEPSVAVDTVGPVRYGAGDVLVLCSDGLTKVVTPPEILKQATLFAPGEACRALVILARERGGPDNISLQVLRAREGKAL
ncbi:serine/threonine-protein phosphatase [bacterium]|nr:serine/threonine-protein phosphatase [bacterium]